MAKLTNVRERVHQPFFDTFVRTAGLTSPNVNERVSLFSNQARNDDLQALTNLENGSTLPSDQSHVTLALRVFTWFRAPTIRGTGTPLTANGDFSQAGAAAFFGAGGNGAGNAPADYHDIYRLHYQSMEQLHWSFGTGDKFSISNMPTKYFPDGGGLSGDNGGVSDLIHWQNGDPSHSSILRLARAVLLPPRQNVKCQAQISQLPDGGQGATVVSTTAQGRNMLSLRDNLNALDGASKVIQFTFDGLFARDVQ
jgi:hypothetical protein